MKCQQINLVPIERQVQRKRSAVMSRWMLSNALVLLVCGTLVASIFLSDEKKSNILMVRADEQKAQIGSTTKNNTELTKSVKNLTIQIESVSMLERRIDWQGVFAGIAAASNEQVRFMQIGCSSEITETHDRVEVILSGFSESQGVTRSFVVEIERLGLFDQVVLEETARAMYEEKEFIRFRIRLVVEIDHDVMLGCRRSEHADRHGDSGGRSKSSVIDFSFACG
jgi:hypothetical protein